MIIDIQKCPNCGSRDIFQEIGNTWYHCTLCGLSFEFEDYVKKTNEVPLKRFQ